MKKMYSIRIRKGISRLMLAILFMFCLTACDTGDAALSLPPKTQDGRNTLGFITNGKVWVNYGWVCSWGKCEENVVIGRLHTYSDKSLGVIIEAYYNNKDKNISQMFKISVKNITGVGTYQLNNENGELMNLITDWGKNEFYHNLNDSDAKLIITRLDTQNHIISGEFSGKLYNYHDHKATTDITDGRFDTKLTYSND